MSECGLLIIIPAFNESATISDVIIQAKEYGEVVVFDDASSDDTRAKALDAGAKVISNNRNLGYERNLGIAFKTALDDQKYHYLVSIDGDGEHFPEDIPRYLNRLESGFDLVCGNRSHKNRVSEEIWAKITSKIYNINDPLCGFKGYSLDFIRKKEFSEESYLLGDFFGTKLLKKMLNSKCSHTNIDIKVSRRVGESKLGVGIRVNLEILLALLRFLKT